jgi:hypothetical protein
VERVESVVEWMWGRQRAAEDLVEPLDGVPPDKLHCPALAIGALKNPLSKWAGADDTS